jgi:hypothetical protein
METLLERGWGRPQAIVDPASVPVPEVIINLPRPPASLATHRTVIDAARAETDA